MPYGSCLSMDISEGAIKFLKWSVGLNKKINLKRCMTLPVYEPQGELNLKEFLKVSGLKARRVLLNLSDRRLVARIVKVPYMEERDLASFVELEIQDFLPVDLEEFDYDYKVLKVVEEDRRKFYNLLLAGVPKDVVRFWVDAVLAAGLHPVFVDIYPNAIARLFRRERDTDAAVIDVGRSSTNFCIFEKGVLFLYACIPVGHGGDAEALRDGRMQSVFNDMRVYLNFYSSRHFGREVDEIYLINDLFNVPGVREVVVGELGREVICDVPAWCYTKMNRGDVVEVIPAYAANLGLILRSMGF